MPHQQSNRTATRRCSLAEGYPAPVFEAPAIIWPAGMTPSAVGVGGGADTTGNGAPAGASAPASASPAGGVGNGAAPMPTPAPVGESGPAVEGVYIISVAARLLEMHPQTLRKYERLGLIQPVRTVGMLRLYSQDDLRKVMLIRHLMDNLGLNLAGVEFALRLVNNLNVFSRRLARRAAGEPGVTESVREEVALLCASLGLPAPD